MLTPQTIWPSHTFCRGSFGSFRTSKVTREVVVHARTIYSCCSPLRGLSNGAGAVPIGPLGGELEGREGFLLLALVLGVSVPDRVDQGVVGKASEGPTFDVSGPK